MRGIMDFGGLVLKRKPAESPKRSGMRLDRIANWAVGLLVLSVGLGGWELIVRVGHYPSFILPAPGVVAAKFWTLLVSGALLYHSVITLVELLAGLALGLSVASVLGYVLARSRTLERLLSPYLVAMQAIPVVALAPLLVIWFGPDLLSKVLVCALTIFFPALVNTIVGLRSVEDDLRMLMRSLRANRWQVFFWLELPSALPVLLGGLKVSVTLAVVGAVIGEFVGADRGLGFLINESRGVLDTPLMFVALVALVMLALALYSLVTAAERRLLAWKQAR